MAITQSSQSSHRPTTVQILNNIDCVKTVDKVANGREVQIQATVETETEKEELREKLSEIHTPSYVYIETTS